MRLILQYDLNESLSNGNQTAFQYFAANPYLFDNYIYYPHGKGIICCKRIDLDGNSTEENFGVMPGHEAGWSQKWRIFEYEEHVILSCGDADKGAENKLFLDLSDSMKAVSLPADIEEKFLCEKTVNVIEDVVLSDYIMRYRTSRCYECYTLTEKLLWKEKHKGYRFTPFEERNGCVIFGTAESGGGLYCYRLSDGESLCAIDTKGTPNYCWQKDLIICHNREGNLIWIDPFSGEIKHELGLDCMFTNASGYWADERYVCAVGFRKRTYSPCVCLIDTQVE